MRFVLGHMQGGTHVLLHQEKRQKFSSDALGLGYVILQGKFADMFWYRWEYHLIKNGHWQLKVCLFVLLMWLSKNERWQMAMKHIIFFHPHQLSHFITPTAKTLCWLEENWIIQWWILFAVCLENGHSIRALKFKANWGDTKGWGTTRTG